MAQLANPVIIGVFKGLGDLLSAAPVILEELRRSRSVHVLLFPNATLHEFCGLIDFAPYERSLHLHALPVGTDFAEWKRFAGEMRAIKPEIVWLSPHAPVADSSWKIPIVLRTLQMLFWGNADLVGAETERLSWLFDRRLAVDRSLPLRQREWSAYRLLLGPLLREQSPKAGFLPEIAARRKASPLYDLVIHPGATAKNRVWPARHYGSLIACLPEHWIIAVTGLPDDIAAIKAVVPAGRLVHYVTGTIRQSIEALASAGMLLVMDSGNMHFAEALGVPTVAIFGYHDPANVIEPQGCVETVYEPRFPCQPCDRGVCSQPEVYCMAGVEPTTVAVRLKMRWQKEIERGQSNNLLAMDVPSSRLPSLPQNMIFKPNHVP